jgi:uncharacterized membrane protein YdcZ (DUF606 family)
MAAAAAAALLVAADVQARKHNHSPTAIVCLNGGVGFVCLVTYCTLNNARQHATAIAAPSSNFPSH